MHAELHVAFLRTLSKIWSLLSKWKFGNVIIVLEWSLEAGRRLCIVFSFYKFPIRSAAGAKPALASCTWQYADGLSFGLSFGLACSTFAEFLIC